MNAIWCEIYIYTLTASYKYYKKGALVWLQEAAHIILAQRPAGYLPKK